MLVGGPNSPRGRGNFGGGSDSPLESIGTRYSKLCKNGCTIKMQSSDSHLNSASFDPP